METVNKIKQLKEEIKAKAEAISNARKKARADLAAARQPDATGVVETREKANALLLGAKRLGEEQRVLLLRYAWRRDRKYRQVEGRTLADKLGDYWEARQLRESLAREISRFGIGRDDILFWMAEDVLPSETPARRAEVEAWAAAEKEIGDARRRAERAVKDLEDVTVLVARLDGQKTFALELAKKRLDVAKNVAADAAKTLAEAQRRAFRAV